MSDAICLGELLIDFVPTVTGTDLISAPEFKKADGDREFMFYRHPSADMLLRADEIDDDAIKAAKLLHFGSITLIDEPARSATLHAIDVVLDSGCLISYDPNLRLALWPDAASAKAGLLLGLSKANIVKVSEDEVEFLTGITDLEEAKNRLWHDKLQLMVITRGSHGCCYYTPECQGEIESYKVKAIDATGAGDGFVAGLLQGILKTLIALTAQRCWTNYVVLQMRSARSPPQSAAVYRPCPTVKLFCILLMQTNNHF